MVRYSRFASTGLLSQVSSTEGMAFACLGSLGDEELGRRQGDGEAELLPLSLQHPVCRGSLLQRWSARAAELFLALPASGWAFWAKKSRALIDSGTFDWIEWKKFNRLWPGVHHPAVERGRWEWSSESGRPACEILRQPSAQHFLYAGYLSPSLSLTVVLLPGELGMLSL